jgi:hypothetical protein
MEFISFANCKSALNFIRKQNGGHMVMTSIGPVAEICETPSPDGMIPHTVLAVELDKPHRFCLFKKETWTSKLLREEDRKKVRRETKTGFVYLMRNMKNGYIKIGFSKKPAYREQCLQSEEPEIEMFVSFKASMSDEHDLHIRYADFRIRGEWFNLSEDHISQIRESFK